MLDLLKKNVLSVGMVTLAAGIVGWSHSQFANIREDQLTIRADIIERIDAHEVSLVREIAEAEDLLIARMLSTTDEVQEQQRVTVSTLQELHFRLGWLHGIRERDDRSLPPD